MKNAVIVGIAIAVSFLGLILSPIAQYQADAAIQNLTKTNVPVTLPLTKGYVDGFEVFYIVTEASDSDVADHLTKLTGSRVAYAPALERAPEGSLANIYVFTNGISGSGPLGFQPNVADSQPSEPEYSPLWKLNMVTWNERITPRELKSEANVLEAQRNNELTITPTKIVVNCPFIKWNGGELQVRQSKALTDETEYSGGQVLDINTQKMTVTFVAHRGFAPDGKTIYYIATDASVKEVADALGVIFVEKTGATLITAAASDLFVFTNGIKGTGPLGFQVSIAGTNVGDAFYSPLWRVLATTWKDPAQSHLVTTQREITLHGSNDEITTEIAGVVVNCPFVEVDSAVDGRMMDKMSGKHEHTAAKTISTKNDLTAPNGEKPFGGAKMGSYFVKTKENMVRIMAKIDHRNSDNKVLEGWLVDVQSGYKLSIGQLSQRNTLVFTQTMVNPWIYDLVVITEEPVQDTDPNPDMPIGGAEIARPFGQ